SRRFIRVQVIVLDSRAPALHYRAVTSPASSAASPSLRCVFARNSFNTSGESAMSAAATAASYVLTLEEIGNLTREGGKPAETLTNVVALIARRFHVDVCSPSLLEADRAN